MTDNGYKTYIKEFKGANRKRFNSVMKKIPAQENYLCLNIYPNKDIKVNIVSKEHLLGNVSYNYKWRPGRLLYIEGERVLDGLNNDQESLQEYDTFAKEWMDKYSVFHSRETANEIYW